jgi:hypothetical protein
MQFNYQDSLALSNALEIFAEKQEQQGNQSLATASTSAATLGILYSMGNRDVLCCQAELYWYQGKWTKAFSTAKRYQVWVGFAFNNVECRILSSSISGSDNGANNSHYRYIHFTSSSFLNIVVTCHFLT